MSTASREKAAVSTTRDARVSPSVSWAIARDVDVPMRDGTLLRADVWLVDDGQPRPTVLFRTPYDKTTLALDTLRPAHCLSRGYHVVVQDTRGRFASEGDWAAMLWDQEASDTYDTVEWVASQEWCDTDVVMAGTSYLGIVQWLGAALQPPHLRAVAPSMTTTVALDIAETGGAFRLDQVFSWLAFMAADWLRRQVSSGGPLDPIAAAAIAELVRDPTTVMNVLPVGQADHFAVAGFPVDVQAVLAREIRHVPTLEFTDIEVPTLSVGGWYDVFCRATVQQFRTLRATGGGGPRIREAHRLIMGPWAHGGTLPQFQGELNFGVSAGGIAARIADKHLDFFDRQLTGAASAAEPPVEYFLCGANEWRTALDWPPPDARDQHWYLHSDGAAHTDPGGTLTHEAPLSDEPPDRYTYDPSTPVPSHGGRVLYLGRLVAGPLSQLHLESRDDVLRYTSIPLEVALDIAGAVTLTLYATSSAVDTDFVAKLCDVYPDGRPILVCDGVLRTRYRTGPDGEAFLTPGEVTELELDLGDIAWRFPAGHRLRLHVTSSNFPHLDRNLNTGNPLGADSRGVVARQQIAHSTAHPSRLTLPILPPA